MMKQEPTTRAPTLVATVMPQDFEGVLTQAEGAAIDPTDGEIERMATLIILCGLPG